MRVSENEVACIVVRPGGGRQSSTRVGAAVNAGPVTGLERGPAASCSKKVTAGDCRYGLATFMTVPPPVSVQ
jgi:hypothetical protein